MHSAATRHSANKDQLARQSRARYFSSGFNPAQTRAGMPAKRGSTPNTRNNQSFEWISWKSFLADIANLPRTIVDELGIEITAANRRSRSYAQVKPLVAGPDCKCMRGRLREGFERVNRKQGLCR